MAQSKTPLRPFVGANIPDELRQQPRWAPWRPQWNEKRQKWDKIPCQASGYGLSTAKPERWLSFDAALAAFKARPEQFAGIGYCMTGPHGLVGTDLDGCVNPDGSLDPWAAEVVATLASYTEISPSGRGLRIFTTGEVPEDWTNHEIGIEVYAGHEPRFLTVTGEVLSTDHATLRAAPGGALGGLAARYAREKATATVISLQMPDLVDELALPDLAELDLPYRARDFLAEGLHSGDRSRELFATAVALYQAGLRDDEVLSVLAASPHAMEVALDHRRQDADRALMYLWVEHAQKAKGRGTSKVATVDDFEDVSEPQAAGAAPAPKKAMRFAFEQAEVFSQGAPLTWMIKRVMPQAEVGVLYGPSGAGKSFLVTDLAMAVAAGTAWRGRQVTQGTVAYICAEGAGGFRLRLRALSEHSGVSLAGLPLHILAEAPNLLEKKDVTDLVAALRTLPGLKLIVVDTLAQTTPGANENSGEDMGRALGHCKTLHRATGAMVLLVAHSGKDETRGIRGWSGIKGALDVEIQVERSDKYRAATITKMKDGSGEGDEFGFSLHTVTLGTDADGEDITSCVVQHSASVPKAQRKAEPKGVWQATVMRVAQGLLDLPGALTPAALIEAAVSEMPPADDGKKDRRRDNVTRAVEALVAANRISLVGGEVAVL